MLRRAILYCCGIGLFTQLSHAAAPALTLDLPLLQRAVSPPTTVTEPNPARMQGVAVLAQGDKVLWSYSYGESQVPGTGQQMLTGSIAKQITATLVLQAVAQQRLTLDSLAAQFLPAKALALGQISIRQLLSHTSGLDGKGQPGQFAYNNHNYQLLADILEAIYAEPFAAQVQRIFRHCGMAKSFVPTKARPLSSAATLQPGRAYIQGAWQLQPLANYPLELAPAGLMVSTAPDLLRWQQCLHQPSATRPLLPPELHQQMVSSLVLRQHRWGAVHYGLGIQVLAQDNLLEWSHGGFLPGYAVTLLYYPAFQLSLVIWQAQTVDPADLAAALHDQDALRQALRQQLQQQAGTH